MSHHDNKQNHHGKDKTPEFNNASLDQPDSPLNHPKNPEPGFENPFTNFKDFMKEFGEKSSDTSSNLDRTLRFERPSREELMKERQRRQQEAQDLDHNTAQLNANQQAPRNQRRFRSYDTESSLRNGKSLKEISFNSVEKEERLSQNTSDKASVILPPPSSRINQAKEDRASKSQAYSNPSDESRRVSTDGLNVDTSEKIPPHRSEESKIVKDTETQQTVSPSQTAQRRTSKRHQKKSKENPYSLDSMSALDKSIFSFNVLLNVIGRLLAYGFLILCLLGMLGLGTGVGYFAKLVGNTQPPSQEEMLSKINKLEQQSTLYYGDGKPIANVQSDLVRSLTNLEDISPYVIDGIIATEDEDFYNHNGVVPKAILRAALQTILQGSGTGGSTITQQLVKQQMLSNDVTFFRKANEILLALRLENNFSKDDILTAYLNVSPFGRNNRGENIAGIAKASEGIFGVKANDVNLNQAAFLVGLPKDPYNYTPYDQVGNLRNDDVLEAGVNRMKTVLYRMYRANKIDKQTYDEALTYDIRKDFIKKQARREERQNYLYQAVMNGAIEKLMMINLKDDGYTYEQVYNDVDLFNQYYFDAESQLKTGGYKVYSTIDKQIYDQLQSSAQSYIDSLGQAYSGTFVDPNTGEAKDYVESVQSGVVVLENKTGKVLGFVAGTDFENNQIDHAFQTRRSPGSTIKPLAVYGPAIQENIINPATIVPDTAYVYNYPDGTTWEPTNYGSRISNTFTSARYALKMSLNLPTIRIYETMQEKGVNIPEYLSKMGFGINTSYLEKDINNLAFSLGGVTQGPTVFEQTRAFSTIANNGQYMDGYYIERIEDSFGNTVFQQESQPVEVFSEDSNYLLLDILRETFVNGSAVTAKNNLQVGGDWIAKTGISENSKDIWMIGSNPNITIGSWIGYDSNYGNYVFDVNDGFGDETQRSQPYWAKIVNDLYNIRPDIFGELTTFNRPDSVTEMNVLETTGTLPGNMNYNGRGVSLMTPLIKDLFKVSNPAPPLTYDFMVGASENDLGMFWNNLLKKLTEPKKSSETTDPNASTEESTNGTDENTEATQEVPGVPDPSQPELPSEEVPIPNQPATSPF